MLMALKTPRIAVLSKGSKWCDIDHRLPRTADDIVISKKYGSAFFGTSLASQLHVLGVDTLFIAGCVTSGCVRASAVDAAADETFPAPCADRTLISRTQIILLRLMQRSSLG